LEALYIKYLKQFSNKSYLEEVFQEMKSEISNQEELLNFENPSVCLNKAYFQRNCTAIQTQLKEYEEFQTNSVVELKDNVYYQPLTDAFLYTKIALKAYTIKKDDGGPFTKLPQKSN